MKVTITAKTIEERTTACEHLKKQGLYSESFAFNEHEGAKDWEIYTSTDSMSELHMLYNDLTTIIKQPLSLYVVGEDAVISTM